MNKEQRLLVQAGYNTAHVHWPFLTYYPFEAGLKRAALIADDHSFTKQSLEQRYEPKNPLPKYL